MNRGSCLFRSLGQVDVDASMRPRFMNRGSLRIEAELANTADGLQ